MPRRFTAEQKLRHAQAAAASRTVREQRRHIVPTGQRPPDDGIVDHIAINLALRGWRNHAMALRRAELVEAVRIGTNLGIGAPELADLLCLWEREVTRFRAELRAQELDAVETVAA